MIAAHQSPAAPRPAPVDATVGSGSETMKAVVQDAYGPPDVLRIRDVPRPTPKDDEVLIRVRASTVTPSDCAFRAGEPYVTRLFSGLAKPRGIPGCALAGEVVGVGGNVRRFSKGDRVVGNAGPTFGAHAEYKCLPQDGIVATMPAAVSYEEAVASSDGALTALHFLREVAALRSGQRILINGASGSVGAAAVQLAKHIGAHVTGVCGPTNVELVLSLGADEVVDYTAADFTRSDVTYDVVFDAVGKSSFSRCKGSLTSRGIYLTTVPSAAILLQTAWTSLFDGKRAKIAFAGLKLTREKLTFLVQVFETAGTKAVIDRSYPLELIADAHRYVAEGHKKGNVIVTFP